MLSFIVLVALVSFSSTYALPQPLQSTGISGLASLISSEHCNFYAALNTQFECEVKSHLMEYSYKYCQRLLDTRDTFTNTKYQDNARQCLQQKLFDKIQKAGEGKVTCDTFKQFDLESHGSCLAVSFKELSVDDVKQFIATFKDTTVNYAQLCKLANGFAGHWSQVVKGDLMLFVKKTLKEVFKEGDTSTCTIKITDIIEEIGEIIPEVGKIVDKIKGIKDDIVLIIEKAKAIRDDFKTIQETVKGMKNGSISELDGIKIILEKSKTIAANSKTIIDTIKKLVEGKSNSTKEGGQKGNTTDISRIVDDIVKIIGQVEALKGEVYKVVDNVDSIIDTIDDIRDGKKDIFDGLNDIVNQLDQGVDNIYSIINTSYTLKETAIDLVETVITDLEGAIDEIVGGVTDVIGGATDAIGGATDAIGGAVGGIGGSLGGIGK